MPDAEVSGRAVGGLRGLEVPGRRRDDGLEKDVGCGAGSETDVDGGKWTAASAGRRLGFGLAPVVFRYVDVCAEVCEHQSSISST